MQITGKLIKSTPVEVITEKFKKCNVIIETDSQYPQQISLEVHNDNIAKLKDAGAKAGDIVTADINLRGRRYEKDGKESWYNTLVLWKMAKTGDAADQPVAAAAPEPVPAAGEDDDLPFN